jgi:fatty-acid desaturase
MIVFGICLLLLAVLIPKLAVLWGIGMLCVIVGVILFVVGSMGHAIGGRRHYY